LAYAYGLVTLSSMRKSWAVVMCCGRLATVTDTVVAFGIRGVDVAPASGQKLLAKICNPFAPTTEPEKNSRVQ
jgi:hypothetical protein